MNKSEEISLLNFFNKRPPSRSSPQLRDATNLIENKVSNEVISVDGANKRRRLGSDECQNDNNLLETVEKKEVVKTPTKRAPGLRLDSPSKVHFPLVSPVKGVDSLLSDDMDLFNDSFREFPVSPPVDTNTQFSIEIVARCSILHVDQANGSVKRIEIRKESDQSTGECFLHFPWVSCEIQVGDIVSVRGIFKDNKWQVTSECMFVVHSDLLLSGTNIVGSLFCLRKSVLATEFPMSDGNVTPMVTGSIVHELLQKALSTNVKQYEDVEALYQELISDKAFLLRIFKDNIDLESIKEEIKSMIPNIYTFIKNYVLHSGNVPADNWKGQISEVLDIEENIWSPSLGMKGKIDASLNVKVNNTIKMMPLELKTGRVSFSNEHRGQVILYCMLLSSLGKDVDSGLLLYIRDGSMKEIKATSHEKIDLLMLRNQLASAITDLERSALLSEEKPKFPMPILNERACSKCQYLVHCSSALRYNGPSLPDFHPLEKLSIESTRHLSESHIEYVFNWYKLLTMEFKNEKYTKRYIWLRDPKDREEDGTCISNLTITGKVVPDKVRFITPFRKVCGGSLGEAIVKGAYVVLSTADRFSLASGFVVSVTQDVITLTLDRDLSGTGEVYHLDALKGSQPHQIALASLGSLLEDTPRSASLREIIIDRKLPSFSMKLSKRVKEVGKDLFSKLNPHQTRALLQALTAQEYILIKGMPGTGKTTTMSALIQLLVRLGYSVLVTSFTHSAVDNILMTLIGKVDFLRLGLIDRVNPLLREYSEHALVEKLGNTNLQELYAAYNSKSVVGVTCLGASHFWLSRKYFDVCLVDESTQVYQPSILKPLFSARKFILIGDSKQLPPLCTNPIAKSKGFTVSLFERLDRPAVTSVLSLQYRMNKVIMSLANSLTYGGLLACGTEEVANATLEYPYPPEISDSSPLWIKKCLSTRLEDSVVFVDTYCEPQTENTFNHLEVRIIRSLLEHFQKCGVTGGSIGVIAPYRAQVSLIKEAAEGISHEIEVNTVDQYQGRDKNIMLYSCTRTVKAESDILGDFNRLNVAITRAKTKLIIVGNVKVLNDYLNFNKLISAFPSENVVTYS